MRALAVATIASVEVPGMAIGAELLRGSLSASSGLPVTLLETDAGRAQAVARVAPETAHNLAVVSAGDGRKEMDDDPYAPLGLRLGSFLLLPSVEVSAGYSSNATRRAGGRAGGAVTVSPEAVLRSDWSRHSATLTLRGAYESPAAGGEGSHLAASAVGDAHIDISADLGAEFTLGYSLDHQSVNDRAFPAGADKPPAVHTLTGSGAIERGVGPAEFTFKVDAERSVYDDATTGAGLTIDQGDRTNTVGELRLRAGYRGAPAITPFLEAGTGRRVFDRPVNGAGYSASGSIYLVRGGFVFDDGPVLTGEGAIGWRSETRDDPRLPGLSGATFDGKLTWSPTRLLAATLNASTLFNPQPDPSNAGSIKYDLAVDIAYAVRANVVVHALAELAAERFDTGATDWRYSLGASAEWRLNRVFGLTARYSHDWTEEADVSRSYVADSVNIGVRLQR